MKRIREIINNPKKRNGTSKYRGVRKVKEYRGWIACINNKHIGTFNTEKEAAIAYNKSAIELLGNKAKLNIIL